MKNSILFVIIASITILHAGQFSLLSKEETVKSVKFTSPEIEFNEENGYTRIANPELGSTVENGMPELPTYSTFFHMEPGKSYSVEFQVVSSHTIEDIEIYPYQGEPVIGIQRPFIKDINFYNSNSIYPENNISVSEPMVMRDIEVGLLTFIPFEYNLETRELIVYEPGLNAAPKI